MIEDFQLKIKEASSDTLCSIIVSNRYLGTFKEEAILAMKELCDRREKGDQFNFEEKIDESLKKLPKIDLNLKSVLSTGFNLNLFKK